MKKFLLCFLLPSILFFSCSQADPVIRTSSVQLLRIQGPAGKFAERLSVFVFFSDGDGTADFDSITVTHDETALSWTIPADECMTRLRGKDLWSGSNNLAGPGDETLPEGSYTIAVSDLAGNEALSTFNLSRPAFPDYAPFAFNIDGDTWTLTRNGSASGFSRAWLFLYDEKMKLLNSWRVTEANDGRTEGTTDMLRSRAKDAFFVQCYAENADGSAGVLLLPVNME